MATRRGEVLVHSADQRDHQDQRRNRQNDAEQHQERAQLVRAHGLQRDERRLAQEVSARKSSLLAGAGVIETCREPLPPLYARANCSEW